jgi:hypothetical protein
MTKESILVDITKPEEMERLKKQQAWKQTLRQQLRQRLK